MGRNMELKKKSLEKDFCNVFMTMCKYGYVFMRILFTNRCMCIQWKDLHSRTGMVRWL